MGARKQGDYPKSLAEFYRRFADDAACFRYLVDTRWPDGFRCPACGSSDARLMDARRTWQCRVCRRQTSATAGTVLHRTKLPLTAWFTAAYLMTSLKPGISALQLQGQLGLTRFETAWFLLHKLRRAMVNPDRGRLSGTVEVDETWIGGKQAGLKGGRQRRGRKAIEVVVAVERRERSLGRLRLEIIRDVGSETLYDFIKRNIEPGSLIVSDAWQGYSGIEPEVYSHQSVSQAAQKRAGGSPSAVPGVDRVTSNLKTWLRGTHHGVGADHLDAYLDEFVFRFNRRYYPMAGFATLLGIGAAQAPTTGDQILSPLTPERAVRRRGRATGLTSVRFPSPPLPLPNDVPSAVGELEPQATDVGGPSAGHHQSRPRRERRRSSTAHHARPTNATTTVAARTTHGSIDGLSLSVGLEVGGDDGPSTAPTSEGNTLNIASDRQKVAARTSAVATQEPSSPGSETNV